MDKTIVSVILDTNVFVAAGFNRGSASAQIIEAVREGRLRMLWNEETKGEIEHIVRKIPPLSWSRVEDLFRPEDEFKGETTPKRFSHVPDPADRKFAALAEATGACLVTNDDHLLADRDQTNTKILTPSEFSHASKERNFEATE